MLHILVLDYDHDILSSRISRLQKSLGEGLTLA